MTMSLATEVVRGPEANVSRGTLAFALPVPKDAHQCDRLLERARVCLWNEAAAPGVARALARFLGANARCWSVERRDALRALLVAAGTAGIEGALEELEASPRADVSDAVEVVVRDFARASPGAASWLVARLPFAASPCVRAVILRALPANLEPAAVVVLKRALEDADQDVREAAVDALARVAGRRAEAPLRRRLRAEESAVVRDALRVALSELAPR